MTSIETLENKAEKTAASLAHVQALLNALDNDPSKWVYEGEVVDFGNKSEHCACGHAIRYGHPLHHVDNHDRIVMLGCVCVSHYAAIDPVTAEHMKKDFENFLNKIAEAKKQAKDLLKKEEVKVWAEKWATIRKQLMEKRKSYPYGRVPATLYWCTTENCIKDKSYKSSAAAIKHYRNGIERMKEILGMD